MTEITADCPSVLAWRYTFSTHNQLSRERQPEHFQLTKADQHLCLSSFLPLTLSLSLSLSFPVCVCVSVCVCLCLCVCVCVQKGH